MPENFALYTRSANTLPMPQMLRLADGVMPDVSQTERGRTFTYQWPDLTIIVSEMPASELAEHLNGFEGYVRQHVYKWNVPERGESIIRNIRATQLVVGVEFQPGRDEQGRSEELLGRMCGGLHPIIFYHDALFDWMSRLLLAPDGTFDPESELDECPEVEQETESVDGEQTSNPQVLNSQVSPRTEQMEDSFPVNESASEAAVALRAKTFSELESLGFRPAKSLPLPNPELPVRPAVEVAARLMALDAVFTWVAFPEKSVETERIENYIKSNRLQEWVTSDEAEILSLPRVLAHDLHVNNIGWRLENMWALAWVLGFEPEPNLEASQIREEVTRKMIYEFLTGLEGTVEKLLSQSVPRTAAEVIAMQYRFYCAHNAVRSAQLGGDTVPKGFHPVIHGGAIHERRHSLSWCIAPNVTWDEVDLST